MKNFHILQISYVPMDAKANPPRIRIKSHRFKQIVTIPWVNEPGEITDAGTVAKNWLESKGFNIIGQGEGNNDYHFIIPDTFEPLKPFKP